MCFSVAFYVADNMGDFVFHQLLACSIDITNEQIIYDNYLYYIIDISRDI